MPTKTFAPRLGQEVPPFQPSETELFPIEICDQMAQALGINAIAEIKRLYEILNYAGSFAHIAAYVDKHGMPALGQRAILKKLAESCKETLELNDQIDW